MSCNWLQRYWHQRLRRIDKDILFESIKEQAGVNAPKVIIYTKAQEGMEHWHCECAKKETQP